ncbi:MAG TPA: hypothetical protein PKZ76_09910, partial [Xanthomonadaceae bacterium]|nr:hypothetical protein [Xanthomonadaceae bacterium]
MTSLVLAAMFVPATTLAQDYKAVSTLQGAGPAQALAVDTQARRLYAGRQGGVDVFDIDSGSKTGSVAVDGNVGGLALAPDLRRGYATSTDRSSVVIFDLDALTIVSTVPSGGKQPRELEYDPRAGVVYVSNAGDGRLAVIDAKSGEPKGSLALGGRLRQASADGRGHLFVAD